MADDVINAIGNLNPLDKVQSTVKSVEDTASSVADRVASLMPSWSSDEKPTAPPMKGESDYVDSVRKRQAISDAKTFIKQIDSAKPDEKQSLMTDQGYNQQRYIALKKKVGVGLSPEEQKYDAERQALITQQGQQHAAAESAGETASTLESAATGAGRVAEGINIAGGTAILADMGVPMPMAIAGGAILDKAQNIGASAALKLAHATFGEDHPIIDSIAQMLGAGVTGGVFLGPMAAAKGAETGAKPIAGANEPAAPTEAPPRGVTPEVMYQPVPKPEALAADQAPIDTTATPVGPEQPKGTEPIPEPPPEPGSAEVNKSSPATEPDHSDAAMEAAARQQPFTREQVTAIPIVGTGKHATLPQPLDPLDMIKLGDYSTGVVTDMIESARDAQATGNEESAKKSADLMQHIADELWPRVAAANHSAGLLLRHAGPPRGMMEEIMQMQQDSPANQMMAGIAALKTPAEQAEFVRRAAAVPWTVRGTVYKLWVNSLLSASSVGKKALSDAANIVWQIPNAYLSEAYSRVTGYGDISPGFGNAAAKSMMQSIPDATRLGIESVKSKAPLVSAAMDSLTSGKSEVGFLDSGIGTGSVMAGSGFEDTWWGRALDFYGNVVGLAPRAITGVDQFAKAMQFNMDMAMQAHNQGYAQAASEGLSGIAHSERAAEIAQQLIGKPTQSMLQHAVDTSNINTFTQELDGSLAKADALRQSSYALRTLVPFMKTLANITLQGIRQSSLAPLSANWRATMMAGGPDSVMAGSKAALGSAVLAYVTSKVLSGTMTGGIPPNLDPESKKLWLRDNQPYSIKSGDGTFTSYEGVEPISWLMATTADMAPALAYMKGGEADNAAGVLIGAALHEFDRQPMWGQVHFLAQALDDAEAGRVGKVNRFFAQTAASAVPGAVGNLAGGIDPVRRRTDKFMDTVRNRVPWLKSDGLPSLDPFGDPMVTPPGFMWNEFPAWKVADKNEEPIVNELIRLNGAVGFAPPKIPSTFSGPSEENAPLGAPTDKIYGAPVTPEMQNKWMELRGHPANISDEAVKRAAAAGVDLSPMKTMPDLKVALEKIMADPRYQDAAESQQAAVLHDTFIGYQKAAEGGLLWEHPEAQGQIANAMKRKVASKMPKKLALGAP